jgi:hypothetical protein
MPIMRAIIILVGVMVVSVITIIIRLTVIVIAAGISWLYGNENLCLRFRWNRCDKP